MSTFSTSGSPSCSKSKLLSKLVFRSSYNESALFLCFIIKIPFKTVIKKSIIRAYKKNINIKINMNEIFMLKINLFNSISISLLLLNKSKEVFFGTIPMLSSNCKLYILDSAPIIKLITIIIVIEIKVNNTEKNPHLYDSFSYVFKFLQPFFILDKYILENIRRTLFPVKGKSFRTIKYLKNENINARIGMEVANHISQLGTSGTESNIFIKSDICGQTLIVFRLLEGSICYAR